MSLYWAQTYPKELERAKAEHWPVLLPIGTMEYHSVHCPYGCDTLIAAGITDAIAQKIDAVVLPPVWYGVASYAVSPPDSGTLQIDCDIFEEYLYNILRSLFKSGFDRNIFILNFHQTEDYLPQALAAMKAAKKLIFQYLEETEGMGWWGNKNSPYADENATEALSPWRRIRIVNGVPAELHIPEDHAGLVESSMMEYLMPGSIKTERLGETDDWFAKPAAGMSAEYGAEIINQTVNALIQMIQEG